jgi:DNA processing protein
MGKGVTIAVLGSGLENIYPAENRKLFYQITDTGAVVSEFSLATEPNAHNFPRRNRIISGMSLGTVVVEATRRSGSLITARLAAEQNREVFAVPGSIQSFKSTGTHTLIKQGAKLVEHAQDIMEEFSFIMETPVETDTVTDTPPEKISGLSLEESKVFEALGPYPVHIDDLARKLAMESGRLSSVLLQLELKNIVQQSPGKFFSLGERA